MKIAFNFSRLVLHRYWVHYINFIFLKFYQTLHRAVSEAFFFLNFTHYRFIADNLISVKLKVVSDTYHYRYIFQMSWMWFCKNQNLIIVLQ